MKTTEGITLRAGLGKIAFFLITLVLAVSSCNNDEETSLSEFSAEDSENAQSELDEAATADDSDDVAESVMSADDGFSGGRVEETDDRLKCAAVTRTGTKASGTIRIDFGSGCTDPRGIVRRGAIIIEWSGRWRASGSFWRLSFDNYFRNGVGIDGVRTVRNVTTDSTELTFTVDLEDGVAKFPDGSIARRRLHHKRVLERGNSNLLERLIIYGTAEGNHRNGRGFYIEILEPLVYERSCVKELGFPLPVSGKKLIKHGDREITVDYGDGTCDNVVTLINKNGRTKDIRVGN